MPIRSGGAPGSGHLGARRRRVQQPRAPGDWLRRLHHLQGAFIDEAATNALARGLQQLATSFHLCHAPWEAQGTLADLSSPASCIAHHVARLLRFPGVGVAAAARRGPQPALERRQAPGRQRRQVRDPWEQGKGGVRTPVWGLVSRGFLTERAAAVGMGARGCPGLTLAMALGHCAVAARCD